MSWEVELWARKLKTGDPVSKAVLMSLANWASPKDGKTVPVSVRRIADEIEASERTVQRHLTRLEGDGFIERVTTKHENGSQGWNAYHFVEYRPTLVSHLPAPKRKRGDNLAPHPDNLSPQGDAGDTLPGDNGVTPIRRNNTTPPSEADASDSPPGGAAAGDGEKPTGEEGDALARPKRDRNRGCTIPAGWCAPPIAELPPQARALAVQWSAGAYATVEEQFSLHFRSAAGAKARMVDWNAAWAKWVINEHQRIMRGVKVGVAYAEDRGAGADQPADVNIEREGEDSFATAIRRRLAAQLTQGTYDSWVKRTCIAVVDGLVEVTAPTEVMANWMKNNMDGPWRNACAGTLGKEWNGIRFGWRGERKG